MIQTNHLYANAAIDKEREVMQDIHLSSKNIAIYERDISFLQEELTRLNQEELAFKEKGKLEEIIALIDQYFETLASSFPLLLQDIKKILRLFDKIASSDIYRLSFFRVQTNMCRRFHTDVNDLRLLCTYQGQGTLWLPDAFVNRSAFQKQKDNKDIVFDESHIQQASAGDVLLLKGALYPEAEAVVHRSPTIEKNNESRVLLRIDTNAFLSFWD